MRMLVSVPTYRRPVELEEFLQSVCPQLPKANAALLVIDNDAEGTGRATVDRFTRLFSVSYVVEPLPGIASVRNRALEEFRSGNWDALIFVDDDEYAADDWLEQILSYAMRSDSGIVTGPVLSILPTDAPSWIVRGGFHQRTVRATGSRDWTAPSNNTLLKRREWERAGSPRFDPNFSRTGGSDTDFFARLVRGGAVAEYCAEAVVYEKVPPSRLTRAWLARRALRMGVVNGRVLRASHGRSYLVARGVASLAVGCLNSFVDILRGKYPVARNWNRIRYGYALAASQFGWTLHEYARG